MKSVDNHKDFFTEINSNSEVHRIQRLRLTLLFVDSGADVKHDATEPGAAANQRPDSLTSDK